MFRFLTVLIFIFCSKFCLLQSQNYQLLGKDILEIKSKNDNECTLILSQEDLLNLKITNQEKKLISEFVNFSVEKLIFISFHTGGPSYCGKTFFEYEINNEVDNTQVNVNIHIVGEAGAIQFFNFILKVSKDLPTNELKVNKNRVKYLYQNQTAVDSICNYLSKKFPK